MGVLVHFMDYNQETKTRQSVEIQREWLDVDRLNAMPGSPVFVDPKNGQWTMMTDGILLQ